MPNKRFETTPDTFIGFSCLKFSYNQELFNQIVQYLKLNDMDISRAFDGVWTDGFKNYDRNDAAQVLKLVIKTKKLLESGEENTKTLWKRLMEESPGTFDRITIKH